MKKTLFLATFIVAVSFNLFAQYNIQLLGKKTYSGQNLSGSWGYNDTVNHKEYGLIGTTKGLSIVDITTPANPVEVKFINGKQGTWRECQTYKQYAYITQDNDTTNSEGILIYDLSLIPNGKADTFKGTTPNDYIARSHSLFIDEKGFLYLNGGDAKVNGTRTNGVMIYDLKPNPMKPTYVGFTQNLFGTGAVNYVHDCYVRNDTMYQAHIYNNRFTVWDVRNRSNPIKIQDFATPYSTIHNMWLSDNSKTLFVSHEQFNFPAEAYDISDLNNIHQLCEFKVSPTNKEILHNVHVLNDYIIGSYYSDGVAIFDASDPSNVICVGYYDTQPNSTKTENGVWGAWGFYKSGVITLSDMLKGLFVVQPTYIRAARMQGVVTDTVTTQSLSGVKISFAKITTSREKAPHHPSGRYFGRRQREHAVEHAQRVEGRDRGDELQVGAASSEDRHAVGLAHAVAHEDQRLGEPALIERAGRVGQVVGHGDEAAGPVNAGEIGFQAAHLQRRVIDFVILGAVVGLFLHARLMRAVVEGVGDEVDVACIDVRVGQAGLDRLHRESARGLLTRNALFGNAKLHCAIAQQHGGRVEALGDAVGPRFEVREMAALERYGIVEAAESQDVH